MDTAGKLQESALLTAVSLNDLTIERLPAV